MNADLFERYSKQRHLQEFIGGMIAKGVGNLAKGAMNALTGGPQTPAQQNADVPQQKDQTVNAMLQADVQSLVQKAKVNPSKYAKKVQQALGNLTDGHDENQSGEGKPVQQKQ
jgi:hypothetical protein